MIRSFTLAVIHACPHPPPASYSYGCADPFFIRTDVERRKYAPGSPYKQILTARPVPSLRDLCTSYIALHPEATSLSLSFSSEDEEICMPTILHFNAWQEAVHKAVFQSPFLTSFIPSSIILCPISLLVVYSSVSPSL